MNYQSKSIIKENIKEKNHHLLQIQKIAHIGYWDWDRTINKLHWSSGVYDIFEQNSKQFKLTTKNFEKLIHPDDRKIFLSKQNQALAKYREIDNQYRIICPNGKIKHLHELAEIFRNDQGDVVRVMGTVQDITEKIETKKILDKNLRLNKILLDSMPYFAVLLNPKTRKIVFANKNAIKIGAVVGKTCFNTMGKNTRPCPWCLAPKLWKTNQMQHVHTWGLGIYWDTYWMPVSDDLYMHFAIDRTNEKKAQDQLIQSEKMSAVGNLASGVAHEFNNLLSIIKGNAQLSMMETSVDEIKKSLIVIETAVNRGTTLVKNLSIFSRPKKSQIKPDKITKIINEVFQLQKKQIALEDIKVVMEYNRHSKILFNWEQMEQVFINLFVNARHAMKLKGKGTIIISIENINNNVQIKFSDTGMGMDEETRCKIFEPFFTTKGAYSKDGLKQKGSGLGLSVAYTIIEQHKGTIVVESKKGKGTTFIITLPIAEGRQMKVKNTVEKADKIDTAGTKHLKVLIVDDEQDIINMMKSILKRAGHQNVVIKKSGKQALSSLKTSKPDVIFLDILMPDMEGELLLKEIKKMRIKAPIVFISGKIGIKKNALLRKGAFDLLEKPFDIEDVFRVLNKVEKRK